MSRLLAIAVVLCFWLPTEVYGQKWASVTGDNFVVHSAVADLPPDRVLSLCRSLRRSLTVAWCGSESTTLWQPKCEIVVHDSLTSYLRVVGSGAAQTMGTSLIELDSQCVVSRRIDLIVGPQGNLPALPHELTHVVLADRFQGRQPPHWFDEGAAMLADTDEKQALHERDCRYALQTGTVLPLHQLLHLDQFTSAEQMPAFYGQSASLLRFLCDRGEITKATQFSLDATARGYEHALQTHYAIASVGELEKQWKQFAYQQDAKLTTLQVRFTP
ncbi:hypothetical protein [Novipirellula artificiosorum]|uniref:Peptidase MA-like domain-containing protein n=1 Tax=Novipirellula artificiosorum TaxID=2528016 RepID=A0A5C6DT18_9BACT|nr:hypothetical protein [Novipirellula artificiosorum]TWU39445.1 hypothetical protein Poly41_22690 [Novipirellula artificiosorum]